MPEFSAPLGAGSPQSVMDYANQQQQLNDISNQRGVQTAGAANDLQAKQRSMQLSMLSGVLNEPDPEKQRDLISKLVPIANKMNPSYQIDANTDVPTIRALVQSQITPTEQATFANQRQLYGMKAETIQKDPATGNLIRVNKYTGESSPVSPQEALQYQASGGMDQGIGSGIFGQPQAAPVTGAQAPIQPSAPSAFGLPLNGGNANDLVAARKTTQKIQSDVAERDALIRDTRAQLEMIQPDLEKTEGGNFLNNAGLRAGAFAGTEAGQAADDAKTTANGLALNLSKLQTIGNSGRTTVAGLQTLLASKPDPYGHFQSTNINQVNHIKGTLDALDAENQLRNAYIEANPLHVYDNRADRIFTGLQKQFPITTTNKDGQVTYNQGNYQKILDAIPDALANPQQYLGKQNAATEAAAQLKPKLDSQGKPIVPTPGADTVPPEVPTPGSTAIDSPEAIKAAYQSGKLTKEQATSLLKSKHGYTD